MNDIDQMGNQIKSTLFRYPINLNRSIKEELEEFFEMSVLSHSKATSSMFFTKYWKRGG